MATPAHAALSCSRLDDGGVQRVVWNSASFSKSPAVLCCLFLMLVTAIKREDDRQQTSPILDQDNNVLLDNDTSRRIP